MPGEKPDQLAKRLIASGQGFAPAPRDGDASPPASRDGGLREPSSPHERWSPRALSPPPVASPEQLAELRQELGAAQTAFAEETNRLDALQEGLERAANERRAAQRAVDAAEEAVRNARLSNKSEMVYAYLNRQEIPVLPLVEAESEQQRAASALQQAKDLENAIETELAHSRYRLDDCRRKLDDALGLVVSRSPELSQLWQQLKDAWQRLRTLRTAFLEISRAMGGQLDGWFVERAQADEPLFAGAVGYDVDETLIRDWVEGIAVLRGDHTALLPGAGRD